MEEVERYGKVRHVANIVATLCQIQQACEELQLSQEFRYDGHSNALDTVPAGSSGTSASTRRMQPD